MWLKTGAHGVWPNIRNFDYENYVVVEDIQGYTGHLLWSEYLEIQICLDTCKENVLLIRMYCFSELRPEVAP